MDTVKTLVLPGLDGTDRLLTRFCQSAPPSHDVTILSLPDDRSAGYLELCDYFSDTVASTQRCTLIGESFSGPLAVLLAHRHPAHVTHLVLVATFISRPIPRMASVIPWSMVFHLPLPRIAAQRLMVGDHKELVGPLQQAARIQAPATLAQRMRSLLTVDVAEQLQDLDCPITYIRPSHDNLVSEHHAEQVAELNEHVTVRQIDGPHLILQAQPERAWEHIIESSPTALSR